MAGEKISALSAVVTPLLTDILPETQVANINVSSSKITLQQILNLFAVSFQGLDMTLNANSSLEINMYNANAGASASVKNILTNEGGADLVYGAAINGGTSLLWGLRVSDG